MLLEVGMTVRDGVPDYKLTRDAMSLETPDGKTIPLPTIEEYRKGEHAGAGDAGEGATRLDQLLPAEREPARAGSASSPRLDSRAMAWDEVELTYNRACLGRVYFKIPGGITYGQHWLNVKFENSLDPRAVPDPDQGRRQAARQALQEHQEAGRGGLQAAEEEELTGYSGAVAPVARPREHVTLRRCGAGLRACASRPRRARRGDEAQDVA